VSVSGDTLVVGAFGHDTDGAANSGAAYVFVRAGGTWSEQARLKATMAEVQDGFGYAVAVSGDTAVVGAVNDDTAGGKDAGSATVFVRSGATWALQGQLLPPDPAEKQQFGTAVSVAGDTAVVGAPLDQENGPESGAAYVFVRSGTTWTEEQKLLAADGAVNDVLGASVSISADTVVVGAPSADTAGGTDAGAAYVFVRSGTVWTEQQKLIAPDGAMLDGFGSAASVSGDSVMVGAWSDDTSSGADAGSAYVFLRSGATWTEQQKLLPADGAPDEAFGYAVSLSGDTGLAGARLGDTPDGVDSGSAYVFVRSGAAWGPQQKLRGSDTVTDAFGSAVSVSGDTLIVGVSADDTPAGRDAGSAYVFVRTGTVWTLQQKLIPNDGAADDYFGISVSVSGDTAVVGARLDDTAAGGDTGSAYVFVRSGTTWSLQQKLLASDGAPGDSFGTSVSVSGDTLLVGAPVADTAGGADAGAAYVFVRSGTTWTEQQKLVPPDAAADDDFGFSASLSGGTAVIGAPSDDTAAGFNAGSAYVFVRAGTTWSLQQKLVASDAAAFDAFGFSVSASGDTALLGAFLDDVGAALDAGSAYAFVRAGSVWTQQQKLLAPDAASVDYFGFTVAVEGDAAVVGAVRHDTPAGPDAGAAYVFARAGASWTEQRELAAPDGAAGDAFGFAVSLSTDTVAVGAPHDDTPGGADAGAVDVFRGSVPVELQSFRVE
jgi:predicted amidohydrolase